MAQDLANFIAECNFTNATKHKKSEKLKSRLSFLPGTSFKEIYYWNFDIDESSCEGESGIEVVLKGPSDFELKQSLHLKFSSFNSMAEYEAIVANIRMAEAIGVMDLKRLSDFQ